MPLSADLSDTEGYNGSKALNGEKIKSYRSRFPSLLTHFTIIYKKTKQTKKNKLIYLNKQLGKTDQIKYMYNQRCS